MVRYMQGWLVDVSANSESQTMAKDDIVFEHRARGHGAPPDTGPDLTGAIQAVQAAITVARTIGRK